MDPMGHHYASRHQVLGGSIWTPKKTSPEKVLMDSKHRSLRGIRRILDVWVVVSNIFYFYPQLGKIPILTNIFQMGWFNHQLDV